MTKKNEKLIVYFQYAKAYEVTEVTENDIVYWKVPVVMTQEGVHSGSRGPMLHLESELDASTNKWEGIPVVIRHPEDENGNYISVFSEGVLDNSGVGKIRNPVMDGKKLKAEVWLEKDRLMEVNESAYNSIKNGLVMEVSIGSYANEEKKEGTYKNKSYNAIARNIIPDHLALLPDEIGACSTDEGCGLRVNKDFSSNNQSKGGINVNKELKTQLRQLNEQGFNFHFIANEQSLQDRIQKIRDLIYAKDSPTESYYIEDVFENYLVYHRRDQNTDTSGMFKQFYSISDGEVSLTGDPVKVQRKVEYVEVAPTNNKGEVINNKNEKKMEVKKCVKDRVDALIANKATQFIETDRDWMQKLDTTALDKMVPEKGLETISDDGKNGNGDAPITKEMAVNALRETIKTPDDFLNLLPIEAREQMSHGLSLFKSQKNSMISAVKDKAGEGVWADGELEGMKFETLKKVYDSMGAKSDEGNNFFGFNMQTLETNVEVGGEKNQVQPMVPVKPNND